MSITRSRKTEETRAAATAVPIASSSALRLENIQLSYFYFETSVCVFGHSEIQHETEYTHCSTIETVNVLKMRENILTVMLT